MGNIPTYVARERLNVTGPSAPLVSGQAVNELQRQAAHAEKREQQDGVVRSMKAVMAFSDWETDYQSNPETGLFHADGFKRDGAKGLYDKYQEDANAKYEEILGSLKGQDEQDLFTSRYQSRLDAGRNRVAAFEARETDAYRKGSLAAYAQSEIKHAVGLSQQGSADEANASLELAVSAKMVELETSSPAERDVAALNLRTAYHKEVFDGLVSNDPDGAQKYLKENRKDIDPTIYNNLESKGKARTDNAKGYGLFQTTYDPDKSLSEIYDRIDGGSATAERKTIAKQLVKDRRSIENADQAAAKREQAQGEQEAAKFAITLIDTGTAYDALPGDVLDKMSPAGRKAVRLEYEAKARGVKAPYDAELEAELHDKWIATITGKDSGFLTENITGKFGSHDRNRVELWLNRQASMNTTDARGQAKLTRRKPHYTAATKLISSAVNARVSDAKKNKALRGQLSERIITHIDDWHDANPDKAMDQNELRKTVYQYIVSGEYDDGNLSIGDPNGRFIDAVNAGFAVGFYADDDKSQYDVISNATGVPIGGLGAAFEYLDSNNFPATLKNLQQAHKKLTGAK